MVHCISLALVYPVCFTLFAYLNKKMAAINWRVVAAVAAADKLTKMAQSVGIDTPNYTPIVPPHTPPTPSPLWRVMCWLLPACCHIYATHDCLPRQPQPAASADITCQRRPTLIFFCCPPPSLYGKLNA